MRYRVYKEDKEVQVYEARTSAVCYNKVWDGKQRDLAETEISYYATVDISGKTCFAIEVLDEKIERVEIRPISFALPYTLDGNRIVFCVDKPCQLSIEVNGYRQALALFVNPTEQKPDKIDRYFGKGEHDAGVIIPKDNEVIYLEEGAIVYGVVYAYQVKNVKICGRGVINSKQYLRADDFTGEGKRIDDELIARNIPFCNHGAGLFNMYGNIYARACENLVLDGIILHDAPYWSLAITHGCKNCTINNVKIIGQWRYNSDGMDICNSYGVVVSNCFVRSFDDCIVVRSPYFDGEEGGVDNIVVKNNVLWCDWGKNLEIWSGDKDTLTQNILFEDVYAIRLADASVAISVKYGSKSIVVRNVKYKNVYTELDEEPLLPLYNSGQGYRRVQDNEKHVKHIWIDAYHLGKNMGNQGLDKSASVGEFASEISNIYFENVKQIGKKRYPSSFGGKNLLLNALSFMNCDL